MDSSLLHRIIIRSSVSVHHRHERSIPSTQGVAKNTEGVAKNTEGVAKNTQYTTPEMGVESFTRMADSAAKENRRIRAN